MFFFAAGAVALFVHNLCTFGFFCLSIYCLLFMIKKKKKNESITCSTLQLLELCSLVFLVLNNEKP